MLPTFRDLVYHSHYRWYVTWLEVGGYFLPSEIWCIIHTTGGTFRDYVWLEVGGCFLPSEIWCIIRTTGGM